MGGIVTETKVTEGISLKLRDKDGLVIADRFVSDKGETLFVDEVGRKGVKNKTHIKKGVTNE